MPRPDWRHMPPTLWHDRWPILGAEFFPHGTEEDDFGTPPFEGCTVEELSPSNPKDACG